MSENESVAVSYQQFLCSVKFGKCDRDIGVKYLTRTYGAHTQNNFVFPFSFKEYLVATFSLHLESV